MSETMGDDAGSPKKGIPSRIAFVLFMFYLDLGVKMVCDP